jgi:hypothetical protein
MSPAVATPAAPAAGERIFNFSAGPAVLPMEVLKQAQTDLLNWQGCGASAPSTTARRIVARSWRPRIARLPGTVHWPSSQP